MKYFIDTEFHEYKSKGVNTIELISIGIVSETGKSLYRISNAFNLYDAWDNPWLKDNVLSAIYVEQDPRWKERFDFSTMGMRGMLTNVGYSMPEVKRDILAFIGDDENPEFYGYFCDYDWVVFCWIFGRMIDLPKHFPKFCIDLKQVMWQRGFTTAWKQANCPDPEGEHNALLDARWNKKLYETLLKI